MPTFRRADLLALFEFPNEAVRDFEVGGVPAQYASGHPKQWTNDINVMDFLADAKDSPEVRGSYFSAISHDHKLLAISTPSEQILIYDINSQELREILDGAGHLEFRPDSYEEGGVIDSAVKSSGHSGPAYTLISSVSHETSRSRQRSNRLILWELDQHGRNLFEEEPIDPSAIAAKAIKAITSELVTKHEWTADFINASALQTDFSESLQRVAAIHRRRHQIIFEDARLGSFTSSSFSQDGKLFLYLKNNDTTQSGMREADKLPCVVMYDIGAGKEVQQLSGHTDAIMWCGISPNNDHVASVSWDGTLRMYSTHTGQLEWVTADSGGQSWSGAFSPDSTHIIWSSKSGMNIQVHQVADGQEVATFQASFGHWCRRLAWHPTRNEVALCADKQVFVWSPFEGPHGKIWQHFEFSVPEEMTRYMVEISSVSWSDDGRLLFVESSEGARLVYDTQNNVKELFKRPKGVNAAYIRNSFYGPLQTPDQAEFYLSVDGDGKARYWRTSVPSFPSWWDKEVPANSPEKKVFPETGKYVKVTKKEKSIPQSEPNAQEKWADKGAELWTAE